MSLGLGEETRTGERQLKFWKFMWCQRNSVKIEKVKEKPQEHLHLGARRRKEPLNYRDVGWWGACPLEPHHLRNQRNKKLSERVWRKQKTVLNVTEMPKMTQLSAYFAHRWLKTTTITTLPPDHVNQSPRLRTKAQVILLCSYGWEPVVSSWSGPFPVTQTLTLGPQLQTVDSSSPQEKH